MTEKCQISRGVFYWAEGVYSFDQRFYWGKYWRTTVGQTE